MFRQALCRTSLKHLPKSYKLRIVCFIKIQKGSRRKPVKKKGRSIGPWHYRLRRHPVWRCLEPCLGLSCSVCFPDLVCLSLLPIDQLAHHFPIHFNWVGSKKTAVGPSSTETTFSHRTFKLNLRITMFSFLVDSQPILMIHIIGKRNCYLFQSSPSW